MKLLLALFALLQIAAGLTLTPAHAAIRPAAAITSPAVFMKAKVEEKGVITRLKGVVVSTKNIFKKEKKVKRVKNGDADMSLTPFVDLAGALLGATATAAAATLDAVVTDEA
jgi:hypothetical protein